jgi:hypothetical protein
LFKTSARVDFQQLEQGLNTEDRNPAPLVARALLNKGEKTSRYF